MNQPIHEAPGRTASAEAALPAIAPIDTEMGGAEPFLVKEAQDIAVLLQSLAEDGDLVTVYPEKVGGYLSGRVLEVRSDTGRLVVEAAGLRRPESGQALLVAQPLGIKLQFSSVGEWQGEPGEPLRWTAELPAEIIHLQRRRFPRLDAPLGPSLRAEFVLHGRPYALTVDDLSLGGVGLRTSARDGGALLRGQQLRRVRLELGQSRPIVLDLEIRSRRAFRSFLAGEQLHFGCRFIELAAPDRLELQRVVEQLNEARQSRGTRL
ncbi:MAG: PilZ domain-containing protein [Burkholderiaceae bacterium]